MARDSEALKRRYLQGAINDTVTQINGYNNSSEVNSFIMGGKRMWLTLEERQAAKMALDAYEHNGEATMTKMWGGTEYTLPISTYRDMLARIEQYASECQNATERHLKALEELETVEAVCDYDYTQGYPEMIDFDESTETDEPTDEEASTEDTENTETETDSSTEDTEGTENTETETGTGTE